MTQAEPGRAPANPGLIAPSRRHQIADWLREQIIRGLLAPGAQLKQDVLAAQLHTSPGPVREALRQLESEGLVHHFPNRGAFVTSVSADELLGVLLPVRLAIESFAIEKVSTNAETLAELARLVDMMTVAAKNDDREELNELDVLFHETIVRSTHSDHAMQLWASVQPRIRMQIHRLARRHTSAFAIPEEHRVLLESIMNDTPELRQKALDDHIVASARHLLACEHTP